MTLTSPHKTSLLIYLEESEGDDWRSIIIAFSQDLCLLFSVVAI